jgi:type I restriction enzyme S subunit
MSFKLTIGRVATLGIDAFHNEAIISIFPKEGIDQRYLGYWLSQVDYDRLHDRQIKGNTLNQEKIDRIPVARPPQNEQARIADILDAVRKSISVQTDSLATATTLKRATMRELFTRGLRAKVQKDSEIGPVPEGWELVRIDGLGQIVTGNTPPTKDRSSYDGGDIPFIAPGDIEHGMRTNSAEKHVTRSGMKSSRPLPKGSTCFVCIGSTIGKVGMTTADVSCTNQQINSVIPSDEFDPGFVFHLLTYWSDHIKKERSPSPVPIMSKGVFEKIEIWATRDKDEQQEISAILDAIDAKIILHKRKKAVVEELFQALLHKLMTGEVRITDLDLSAFDRPVNEAAA